MNSTFLSFIKYQVSQVLARISGHTRLSVSIGHLEGAKTVRQLTRAIKKIQSSFWKLSLDERTVVSQRVTAALSQQVLAASDASLKLVAADWLRFLMQVGIVARPETVFVTLVSAALEASQRNTQESIHELGIYLRLIYESLWPFRSPYASYPRRLFPHDEVFYPLIPLFSCADTDMRELLGNIFTHISMLDIDEN